jgi:hypothetical protein
MKNATHPTTIPTSVPRLRTDPLVSLASVSPGEPGLEGVDFEVSDDVMDADEGCGELGSTPASDLASVRLKVSGPCRS